MYFDKFHKKSQQKTHRKEVFTVFKEMSDKELKEHLKELETMLFDVDLEEQEREDIAGEVEEIKEYLSKKGEWKEWQE